MKLVGSEIGWAIWVAGIAAAIFIIELIFRTVYRLKNKGRDYHVSIKFPWSRSYVIAHPFLSFAYKPGEIIDRNQKLPYPLHYYKYSSFKEPIQLNSQGHFGRDISQAKKPDVLRVACLGDSTTANSVADENGDYSYPVFLEKHLMQNLKREVEVYNCGIPGWVSADIMIDFFLNILPNRPDILVLYHGFTDLHLYLMDEFKSDYSHGRKNFAGVVNSIRAANLLPKIPFLKAYEYSKDRLIGTGNARNDVIEKIRKKFPNIKKRVFSNGSTARNTA